MMSSSKIWVGICSQSKEDGYRDWHVNILNIFMISARIISSYAFMYFRTTVQDIICNTKYAHCSKQDNM